MGTTTTLYDVGLSTTVADESVGNTQTWYQLTPSLQPIAVHKGSTTQYLADDGRGSVGTVVDSGGTAQCTVRYDPFGQPVGALSSTPQALDNCNSVGTAPLSDVWYHGQRQDGTTGDYQFGPRTYDPAKGTFLTPDSYSLGTGATNPSVGTDPLTANTYTYVNGDPVNLVDPNGHKACLDQDCYQFVIPKYSTTKILGSQAAVDAEEKAFADEQHRVQSAWSDFLNQLAMQCGDQLSPQVAASCLYGDNAPQVQWAGGAVIALPGAVAAGSGAATSTGGEAVAAGGLEVLPAAAVIAALWPHDAGQSDADEMADIHRLALQNYVSANLADLESALSQARAGKALTVDELIWNLEHLGMPEFGVFPPPSNWKPPVNKRVGLVIVATIITGLGGESYFGKSNDSNESDGPSSPPPAPRDCPTPPPGASGVC